MRVLKVESIIDHYERGGIFEKKTLITSVAEFLTTYSEVAEYFDVSRQCVYEWLKTKKLSHTHTPGGQIRIPRESVERYERALKNI